MPKYKENNFVSFISPDEKEHCGYIFVIDILSDSITYDIFCKEETTIYKHIQEKYVRKIIDEGKDDFRIDLIRFAEKMKYVYDDRR